jgi:hypothetical protein
MGNEALREQWRARLKLFARSKQTVSVWCAQHDVSVHQFYYWRRRLEEATLQPAKATSAKATSGDNWLAVAVVPDVAVMPEASAGPPPAGPPSAGGVTIRVGAATIEVSPGFDRALLRTVVQALESAPC